MLLFRNAFRQIILSINIFFYWIFNIYIFFNKIHFTNSPNLVVFPSANITVSISPNKFPRAFFNIILPHTFKDITISPFFYAITISFIIRPLSIIIIFICPPKFTSSFSMIIFPFTNINIPIMPFIYSLTMSLIFKPFSII